MKVIIDRFEGDYAVCEKEDQEMIDVKKKWIPLEAKPGDVLIMKKGQPIILGKEETDTRKQRIEKLTEDMWE